MKSMSRTRRLTIAVAALALMNATALANAQAADWPTRPIRIVVPYPTGGVTDSIVRVLAERISSALGQPVFVENRAGAGGTLGVDVVAKASPDGYTIGFAAISPLTLNPHVMKVPYDALRDVTAIGSVMYSPVYLLATPKFKGATLQDAIALCKASPGSVAIATSGYGSVGHVMVEQLRKKSAAVMTHVPYKGGGQIATDAMGGNGTTAQLATEMLKGLTGMDLNHIPYKGNPAAMTDLIGGRVVAMFDSAPSVIPRLKAGQIKVLGIAALSRSANEPDIPTIAEQGVPGFEAMTWIGLFAPAGTPRPIVDRLNAALNKVVLSPALSNTLEKAGAEPAQSTPDEFAATLKKEVASWGKVIRDANIKLD